MSSIYLTRAFWVDAAERSIRAASTWSLTSFGLDGVAGILNIDFQAWVSGAVLAMLISLLMSLSAAKIGDDSASFVSASER